jgi:anti-sigma factor RsiW
MKCKDLLAQLSNYVDGEIDPKICQELEKHLAGCNPCKVVLDTLKRTVTLYKGDVPYELPLEVRDRLHSVLEAKWKQGRAGGTSSK